ncbi:kinase-like domain-containing protein [Xylaria cf. heliscus]|nr:kinase-like domain-containing protein [Xylaria cf. heliscus]
MGQPQAMEADLSGDNDDDNAEAVVSELQGYFSRSRIWECEKALGNGAYGAAILVKERSARDSQGRRVVLKRALSTGIAELKVEIATLKKLRGNAHVARLLASCEDLTEFADPGISETRLQTIFTSLRGLRGPALVQEYCQNGTIDSLKEKAKAQNIDIPNRLLWRFYLCLVRACIGLAYGPRNPDAATAVLEEIPSDRAAGDLVHGDIAGRNMVIGDTDPSTPEHSTIPILKLIDFGSSGEYADAGKGVEENLHSCAVEMLRLIRKGPVRTREQRNATYFEGVRTVATDILPGVDGVPRFPNLDPKLRDLLVQALRTDRGRRPTLAEMLAMTRNGGGQGPVDDTRDPDADTIQRLIYDT